MQRTSKVIFRISLILIIIYVIVPLIGHFTPMEWADNDLETLFEMSRFFVLPVAILLTLFGTIKPNDGDTRTAKIVVTTLLSFFSFFAIFILAFTGMCAWANGRTLFENKNDPSAKIILRDFGCGATDSGSPTYKVCKIQTVTPLFIWVTAIDTTTIDRKTWQRVESKE